MPQIGVQNRKQSRANLFLMERTVLPEILDSLPADHCDALRSRIDLKHINRLMGNNRWFRKVLRQIPVGPRVLELGSGDGSLALAMPLERVKGWTGFDLLPRPVSWPSDWDWHQGDFLQKTDACLKGEVLVGNLILHHFSNAELAVFGRHAGNFELLLFNEPLRRPWVSFLSHLIELTGINHVTRHDMRVSIRAGFRNNELPELLGLSHSQWRIEIGESFFGAYRLKATKRYFPKPQ